MVAIFVWMLAWANLASASQSVAPRGIDHLLYDPDRGRLLLLAAWSQSTYTEIWTLSANGWSRITNDGPPPRELGAAAYDTRRQRLVLHGGLGVGGVQDRKSDAWEWDGAAWHQVASAPFGARDHHAMAYDESRGRTVLFGGSGPDGILARDTWEWDGTTWTRVAADGPPGRAHFGMVYDSTNRRVLIVGGLSHATSGSGYRALSDSWAWDGVRWTRLDEGGLTPRTHFRIAFDRLAERVVLFGGMADGRLGAHLGDTWLFDGRAWSRSPAAGPASRTGAMIAYDGRRNRTVLVGGGAYDGKTATRYDDTWEWNGSAWSEVR